MDRTLGPRNLGEIIKETFTIYGRNFWRFVAIAAIVTLPVVILIAIVLMAILFPVLFKSSVSGLEAILQLLPILIPAYIIVILISIVAGVLTQGAMVHGTAEQYFRQPIGIGRAFRFSWKRMPNTLGTTFLVFITLIAVGAILVIPIAIILSGYFSAAHSVNPELIILAIVLAIACLVAGIYISIIWQFALQTALLEGCNPITALSRSFQLVNGNWWRVLGIIVVLVLIVFGINLVLRFVPIIGPLVAAVFAPPITAIGAALLYFDLRVRKQGYTLDALANELGLTNAPTGTGASLPE